MKIAIIIPVLNEAKIITASLAPLQGLRTMGHEVIVVDGGSEDNTVKLAARLADQIVLSGAGRGQQMNRGAGKADADLLLFLHADTRLPADVGDILSRLVLNGECWGRFDIRLSGHQPVFRVIEYLINLRSSLSGIATGDQAMFVTTALFHRVGGFPEIALMEDIALSKRLRALLPPIYICSPVTSSSRRWEQHGIISTIFRMWKLRALYALGYDPDKLARLYE